MKKRALFLDRDGVINVDHGYVCKSEQIVFVEGIFELVRVANDAGYLVIIVTNQAGIGRGYYCEADFHNLMDWMKARFADHGATIDAVYFSPYHPEHGLGIYRKQSSCRKPSPGMLLQAQTEFGIDMGLSTLIGDKVTDIQAGAAAGVGTLLILNSEEVPDNSYGISDLKEAVPYLLPPLQA